MIDLCMCISTCRRKSCKGSLLMTISQFAQF
nr:MAG TPA: hypothetical protein [Caudoviricetes sp.]